MTEKTDEIYAHVLPEMAKHGIEDTIENRYWFLNGLYDAWKEETDIEALPWKVALIGEIMILKMKLDFKEWRERGV